MSCMTSRGPVTRDKHLPVYEMSPHQEMVDWFSAKVLNHDEGTLRGVCSSSSSDSLYAALRMAKYRFVSEWENIQPVIFASNEGHASLPEISKLLHLPLFRIAARKNEGMDMDLLREIVEDEPYAIVVLTMGSSFHQLYDDIEVMYSNVIAKCANTRFHIHIDATFGGLVYPFLCSKWLVYPFDSMNVSIHRHLDIPYRCSMCIVSNEMKAELMDYVRTEHLQGQILSDNSVTHLLHTYLFPNNEVKSHIRRLTRMIEKKNHLFEMNEGAISCHPLSFIIHFKNVPNEKKDRLTQFGMVSYQSVGMRNAPNSFSAYVRITKDTTLFTLQVITSILFELDRPELDEYHS